MDIARNIRLVFRHSCGLIHVTCHEGGGRPIVNTNLHKTRVWRTSAAHSCYFLSQFWLFVLLLRRSEPNVRLLLWQQTIGPDLLSEMYMNVYLSLGAERFSFLLPLQPHVT